MGLTSVLVCCTFIYRSLCNLCAAIHANCNVFAFMLLHVNQNQKGEQIFSPIVSRDNETTKNDGGGLLLKGNPISSFTIRAEARELVLGNWFHILGSLPDVSKVYFEACDLGGNRLHMLLETLRNHANLSGLYLPSNRIISLLPLKEFFEKHTGLTDLWLQDNQITSLSGLETATGLKVLDLKQNQITDISGLAKFTGLTRLSLSRNQITDISGLAKLTRLTYLSLYENKIISVLPLTNLTSLTHLHLSHNQITDISGLAKLTRLTYLSIYNNPINKTDINALRMKLPNVDIRV